MRVLHFYKSIAADSRGGIEQVISQLAMGSVKAGLQAETLSLTADRAAPRAEVVGGVVAHRAQLDFEIASTGFSYEAISRFSRLAREADVVHYHYPWPFMDLAHFIARTGKPSVVTYHSDIIRQLTLLKLYRPLQRRFLQSVDRIVATSANYLATSGVLGSLPGKVTVIPIGLDRSTYPEPSAGLLRYWQERLGPKFFLFVGVLRYYKGLHVLLEAAAGTDFPIVIAGAGPIEDDLKAQAGSLGLRKIQFLGRLPDEDKVALLTLCHAVVFPSHLRAEAFGVSLLEGAMFGKPMISSEIGTGTTYVNRAGETGLVVPPGDPAQLRHAMQWLWDRPSEAAEMGRNAEARYRRHFTSDAMVKAYAELYREIASGPTRTSR